MTFSVVVATYNRLELLKECLRALQSQIFSAENYEVIIVDDGSTDGTSDYLKSLTWGKPRLRIFFQFNQGPAAARNLGVTQSSGQILVFTDDDCLVGKDWLSSLYDGYQRFPEAGGIGGYLEAPERVLKKNLIAQLEFFETHTIYKAGSEPYLGDFESPAGGTNNMSYPKNIIEKIGGFDENFPVPAGEDADLKLRVVQAGYKIGYLPLRAIHLDPYSFKSFVHRSIRHGVGSAFFEVKHAREPTIANILLSFVLLPKVLLRAYLSSRSWSLAVLIAFKNCLMGLGRLQYLILYGKPV